jgi:hypothetical protein
VHFHAFLLHDSRAIEPTLLRFVLEIYLTCTSIPRGLAVYKTASEVGSNGFKI